MFDCIDKFEVGIFGRMMKFLGLFLFNFCCICNKSKIYDLLKMVRIVCCWEVFSLESYFIIFCLIMLLFLVFGLGLFLRLLLVDFFVFSCLVD